jgi:uncharacterized cupredoxin-like copper-binding protein
MISDAPPGRTSGEQETSEEPPISVRLTEIERELRTQGDRARGAQRNFSIFAVLALLIALGTLIAVAAKLQAEPKNTAIVVQKAPTAAPTALPSTDKATLTEMRIALGSSTVAAGKVRFNIVNAGAVPHEMVVLDSPTPAGKLPTDSKGRADETGNIGETGDMKAGATKKLTLNLKAGHYALICNLPGHYKAGMYTDLTVK